MVFEAISIVTQIHSCTSNLTSTVYNAHKPNRAQAIHKTSLISLPTSVIDKLGALMNVLELCSTSIAPKHNIHAYD